ncbi:MAG: ROK family transcriptional regulator [Fusobacterium mortiferum]|nr:ROK family transcriptional regulator [Fusobacterium mortiferum]
MRKDNKEKILYYIFVNKKATRNELTKFLNISKMGVSKLVTNLIERKLIFEDEVVEKNSVGKKERYLKINREIIKNILTIYFGLDKVVLSLMDVDGNEKKGFNLLVEENISILKATKKIIRDILSENEVMLISIGMNGIVDSEKGIAKISTYYHWKNINLKEIFEEEFGISVFLENGVNMIAYSQIEEHQNESFAILNIENGVGSTIVRYDREKNQINLETKEIGHIPFDFSENSLICVCGNKGCVETIMANWRIEEKIKKNYGLDLTYEEILKKANKNEKMFRKEIMDMITPLSSLILWLDILGGVEKIIITGKITYLEDFFWKELRRVIKNNLLIKEKEIEIIKREYSENIILKGALRYGIDNFINSKYFKSIMKESEKVEKKPKYSTNNN